MTATFRWGRVDVHLAPLRMSVQEAVAFYGAMSWLNPDMPQGEDGQKGTAEIHSFLSLGLGFRVDGTTYPAAAGEYRFARQSGRII